VVAARRDVTVRLLGPFEVRCGEETLRLAARPSLLLATLAVWLAAPVSYGRLAELLWPGRDQPADSRRAIQTYASRLREVLGRGAISSDRDGLRLELGGEQVDLHRFRDLAAGEVSSPVEELDRLTEALALWRGEPLEGGALDVLGQAEGPALVEELLAATERAAQLRLELDRIDEVFLTTLSRLTGQHPWRERLWGQLMLGLHRTGRQGEALTTYQRLVSTLREDLGVDPGPEIVRLHQQLLAGGPPVELVGPKPPAAPAPETAQLPADRRRLVRPPADAVRSVRQLPAPPPQFTGRAADLLALDEVRAEAGPMTAGPVVIAIDGMAGIGKTAFAAHAAHRWSSDFPDGQFFLDLRGHTRGVPPVDPGDALHRLLRSLGVPGANIPDGLDECAALYRSHLAGRRVLVLLDNAASESQVAPLLPGAAGCLVLITSRRRLTGLDLTHAHSLDLLPADDAVTLFVRSCGRDRVRTEPRKRLTEAVELCGRLPLAIRIAAARLGSRPSWTAAHLVERLRSVQHRLAELEAGERSVTAALELSYVQLGEDVRYTYRMLGLHPGLELGLDAAAALTGRPAVQVRGLLEDLLDVHLLHESVPGRYRFHDLTWAYAANAAREEEAEADRCAAGGRLLEYYCQAAESAIVAAYPYERENRSRLAAATREEPTHDPRKAATWLDTEISNLLVVAEYADRHGRADCVVRLSAALHSHLRTRGGYGDAADLHGRALAAARSAGDRAGELDALNDLGHVRGLQGRRQEAIDLFTQARQAARSIGNRHGELNALVGLAHVYVRRSRYTQATESFGEARRLAAAGGHRSRELEVLCGLGWVNLAQGQAADEAFTRAREIADATGHTTGLVGALTGLGHSHRLAGRHEMAMAHCEQALQVARVSGDSFGELDAMVALGFLHRDCGRLEEAGEVYRRSLILGREIGCGIFEFEALYGLGRLHHAAGRHHEALAHHQEALDLATDLGHAAQLARAHDGVAHAELALDRPGPARRHWQRALSILTGLRSERTLDKEVTTASIRAHLACIAVDLSISDGSERMKINPALPRALRGQTPGPAPAPLTGRRPVSRDEQAPVRLALVGCSSHGSRCACRT
jgi:DNA-binding SARP family transcriptional activator/tetratricopeptide (TPR) repeat protein